MPRRLIPKIRDERQLKAAILDKLNPRRLRNPYFDSAQKKVTEKEVVQIRELYVQGATQEALAGRFELCQEAIGKIVRGDTWKNAGGPLKPTRALRRGGRKTSQK